MSTDHQIREPGDLGWNEAAEETYGKILGICKGTVKDINDPDQEGRVRIHIPTVMGGDPGDSGKWTDWAEPMFRSSEGGDNGSCDVPPVGSLVWVQFKMGHPDYPLYSSDGWKTTDKPMLKLAKGEDDGLAGQDRNQGGVLVPKSQAGESVYPYNHVWKLKSGHVIEVDETEGKTRVRVRHPSGTFVEMTSPGDYVRQVLGDALMWAGGNIKYATPGNFIVAVGATMKVGSASAQKKLLTDQFTTKFNSLRTEHLTHLHVASGSNTSTPTTAAATTTRPVTSDDYTTKLESE